jgi:hypothetical protein
MIVHEVLLAADLDGGKNPQQSDQFLKLDPKGELLLAKRITDSLGSDSHSIELGVDIDREGSAFDLITKLLDAEDKHFISTSKELALMLTKAQSAGTIKAGICVVLDGTMGSNSKPERFVAVLKAESDAGFIKESTPKVVLLKYISDMVLGAQQRLFKIGCFIEKKAVPSGSNGDVRLKDDFSAIVYDHQMSNTGDNNAARYFYATFLGCRLADNAQRLTRAFYEETSKHIDEAKLPARKRVDLKNHLVSYLKSEEKTVNPRTFAERFLPKSLHESYFERFRKTDFPSRDVPKDNHQIRRKLQVRRMFFSSKVRISAPEENFNDLVKIVETKDGWTTVNINGELEAQT